MWDVTGQVADDLQRAIIAHLKDNCAFKFQGSHRLTADLMSFYPDTLLCQLVLGPGSLLASKPNRNERLEEATAFYFLFRHVAGDQVLIPLAGGCGNIHLANQYLGLRLENDQQRLAYARFYCAFGRVGSPPQFVNLPRQLSDLRFDNTETEQRRWVAYGALWRFLDRNARSSLHVQFEKHGVFAFAGHRAHLPIQFGSEVFDVELKVWQRDGHLSLKKSEVIYADKALTREPQLSVGRIAQPRYITRRERLRARIKDLKAVLSQVAYLVGTGTFLLTSLLCLAFPLEIFGFSAVRQFLSWVAATTGIGSWQIFLRAICIYCAAYFALTTFFILDTERMRSALLTLRPALQGGWLDEWLHEKGRRQERTQRARRLALWKRIALAMAFLLSWSAYLVFVFTSLQASLSPGTVANTSAIGDVMTVFAQQAMLYVPLVVYYMGRNSLDPLKLALVAQPAMFFFRLFVGLLVIRRIHRFWASTSRAKLHRV